MYLVDRRFSVYEFFQKFHCPELTTIKNYIIESECLYNNIKNYDIALPGVLTRKFLNSANVTEQYKQLVCATLSK